MRVFLIGYKGSGKSTTGIFLSQKLNVPFFDLDKLIEGKVGKAIPDLYREVGEEKFRIIETENLINLIENTKEGIIATGGGTPRYANNMNLLLESGYVIYIKVPDDILLMRWKEVFRERPIFKNIETEEDLKTYLYDLKNKYENIYSRANYIFDFKNQTLDDLLIHLKQLYQKNK